MVNLEVVGTLNFFSLLRDLLRYDIEVLYGSFFVSSNIYQLNLHTQTRVAVANLR